MVELLAAGVAFEVACWGKFAKLVAYHEFSHIHRDKLVTIVYSKRMSYKIRSDS